MNTSGGAKYKGKKAQQSAAAEPFCSVLEGGLPLLSVCQVPS